MTGWLAVPGNENIRGMGRHCRINDMHEFSEEAGWSNLTDTRGHEVKADEQRRTKIKAGMSQKTKD
jgi:hypothetical protein